MSMILLNPGPANTTVTVKRALTKPDICPREKDFGEVLVRVRENARDSTCKSNLRQLGIGFMQNSTRTGYLCSGAWDWKRDGAVTDVGWVADLVHQGTRSGDLLARLQAIPRRHLA